MSQSPSSKPQDIFLEDLSVGQVFPSGTWQVDEAQIVAFATQFDPQAFHVDDAAARRSFFGGLAASGWHTAAITMRLMVDSPFHPAGGLIGAGFEELRWPRPVRPGDTLRVEVEVLELRPSKSRPEIGLAKTRTTTFNQHNEPVQQSVGTVVVRRRPS